ncbi:MAG: NUDIX domain-containing protein [Azospirillum sp.]|nr:NUDIX domain-containing protein [Azospirillum sp.]
MTAETDFLRPLVTVDVVILTLKDGGLQTLLMKRAAEPFRGDWALVGGYIHPEEDDDLEAAARRILGVKAGIAAPYVEQLQGFGDRRRDPRGWTVTFAYVALIASEGMMLSKGANADSVAWWPVAGSGVEPALAFDHTRILAAAVTRIRNKVEYTSLPVHLMPPCFTLTDLQRVYEQILGRPMDKSQFRRRIAEAEFLEAVPGEFRLASNRPAQLYRIRAGLSTIFFDRTI